VEFQKKSDEFQDNGISVIGISYDSVHVLKAFADKHGISYPLLSDVNSEVIKKFGILDKRMPQVKKVYGVPYPGIYIIDKNLKVVKKHFEKLYVERPTAENVLVTLLDKKLTSNYRSFQTSYLDGTIAVTDTVAYPSQLLSIIVEMDLKDGFHLYGKPVPDGYIPLTVKVEDKPNFTVDAFKWPEARKFVIESIDETFHVLPQKIRLQSFIRIKRKPALGRHLIKVNISFQACDEKTCMLPEEFAFSFPLLITDEI